MLGQADLVACEDTRTTRKLMNAHGLAPRLATYHEHNAARVRPGLIARIKAGAAVALVSDAGTPLVSDPGYKLVRAAIDEDLSVTAVPGASAPLAALMVSGLPSDRFLFAGFLPPRTEARRKALAELRAVPATLIVFESARRLAESLADMAATLGPRPAAVARELTKLHEEVRRGALDRLADDYAGEDAPKGEVVVVIGPPGARDTALDETEIDARLRVALAGGTSLRDAVAAVAAEAGQPRQLIYTRALALTRASDDADGR